MTNAPAPGGPRRWSCRWRSLCCQANGAEALATPGLKNREANLDKRSVTALSPACLHGRRRLRPAPADADPPERLRRQSRQSYRNHLLARP